MSARGERRDEPWRKRARRLVDEAVNFVLPPVCVSCNQVGAVFCNNCERTLTWFSDPRCGSCGRPLPGRGMACAWCQGEMRPLKEVRAVCAFDGAARDAIHALKYEGMFGVAEPLARLMARRFPEWSMAPEVIVPIPLHPERVRERGYNQATYLARHLCRRLDLAVDEAALWRTRHTRPQVGLDRLQRRQNVAGAFAAADARVRGRRVLLVDDVCTSGATLAAAAEALLEQGAAGVSGYCFARPAATVEV